MRENIDLLLENTLESDSVNELKSLIDLEVSYGTEAVHKATGFALRDELFKNLFDSVENVNPSRISSSESPIERQKQIDQISSPIHDRIILSGWKTLENISARLIEFSSDQVVLECLIDKENRIYEERVFLPSLFNGYDLKIGNLFYLRFFERQNEIKLEIHDDPDLTSEDDFPKLDFVSEFKNSKLFKKSN